MERERLAPAKVNLFLHVGQPGADGYHPIASLVTFADFGDVVRLRPAREMGFSVEGPFADDLGATPDNLVVRARDLALAGFPDPPPDFHLALEKRLPIASGLGGGSSDAAATLMLMGDALGWGWLARDKDALLKLAARLGADVPMCLNPAPRLASGRGEELDYPPPFPDLEAVLVNPLVPSPTGEVYRAYDAAGAPGDASVFGLPESMETPAEIAQVLARCRNDLEAPAISRQPAIAQVLAALRARPETLLARMSGSGATCFALCRSRRDRRDLALAVSSAHPDWWVKDCRLAGFRP